MMNLSALRIPPEEAKAKLAEYQAAVREQRTAEDLAIAAGYRAAARGLPVISLTRTLTAGGWHDNGLPRIAIVRADAQQCFAHWDGTDLLFYSTDTGTWDGRRRNRGALVGKDSVRVRIPGDDLPSSRRHHSRWGAGQTIVPLIPPRYRPKPRRLRGCHILWEVEAWTPVPPRDPALLRHIRGDLWAVLAVWDLTDLERLVLSQR